MRSSSTLPIPSFVISQHLFHSTARKGPLVVDRFDPGLFVEVLLINQSSRLQTAYWAHTMTIREELVQVEFNIRPTDLM